MILFEQLVQALVRLVAQVQVLLSMCLNCSIAVSVG
jgi:hypothetical protein